MKNHLPKSRGQFYSCVACAASMIIACGVLAGPPATTRPDGDQTLQGRPLPELRLEGMTLPAAWKDQAVKRADTHVDAEWKSPGGKVVVGAVYIHAPFLASAREIIKSVKKHYTHQQPDGKMTQEWTDSSARNWFEVDAAGTHSKAFVIAHGRHAWFLFYRYSTDDTPQSEIAIAENAINHVTPTSN